MKMESRSIKADWHLIILLLAVSIPIMSCHVAENFRGFIDDPDGVAFKTIQGRFLAGSGGPRQVAVGSWSVVLGSSPRYDNTHKLPETQFMVRKADGGSRIYLECLDYRTSSFNGDTYAKVFQNKVYCGYYPGGRGLNNVNKFDVFKAGDGSKVALRSVSLGQFACFPIGVEPFFIHTITPDSSFTITSGALLPTTYEMINVEFNENGQDAVSTTPTAVKTTTIRNNGASTIEHNFLMEFSEAVTETTTWEHAFGAALTASYESPEIARLFAGKLTFSATLKYDYKNGGTSSETTTRKHSESVKVSIPASSSCTVKLMIRKKNDASIPFTATFKKVSFDQVSGVKRESIIQKRGTWFGVLWLDTQVVVNTSPIPRG